VPGAGSLTPSPPSVIRTPAPPASLIGCKSDAEATGEAAGLTPWFLEAAEDEAARRTPWFPPEDKEEEGGRPPADLMN